MTDNGGRSFHVGRVSGYTEANVALKNSCHSVAIHPTDPTLTVISSGFKAAGSEMRLFRSAVRFPGSYVGTRSALGTAAGNSPWVRVRNVNKQTFFLQWNRDTPTVVYEDSVRSLDGGQTWVDYGSGFGGCRAVFPGNHDICYGLTRLTGPERYELRRSNDRGATHSLLANIGWGGVLFTNFYYAVLAIHPTDPAVFFTVSSTGDLARYDGNTGAWRTGYGMPARHQAAHPGRGREGQVDRDRPAGCQRRIRGHGKPRQSRHLAVPEHPGGVSRLGGHHHGLPPVHVFPKVWVHPLTGDVLAGSDGVGGVRMLPPPGRRSHLSLIGNWPVL